MIFRKTEADYFSREGWTGQISLKLLGIFAFWRIVFCGKFPDLCPLKTCILNQVHGSLNHRGLPDRNNPAQLGSGAAGQKGTSA
jgi:hypothetical protein